MDAGDAVLLIDVINDLSFPGGERVLPWAERMVPMVLGVIARARRAGIPVIYANDHFDLWHGSRDDVVRHCTRRRARERHVSARLAPKNRDYFILKARHSAFFATPLRPLLEHLGVERLILAGMATNMCVVATAHDAAMHGYPLVVLSDCCAAESDFDHNVVLSQLERFFDATICRSTELGFPRARVSCRAAFAR
ncbi:MAG TPA: isochorismatase family cysteine hydrolase [Phycisphaerales bacterium]|nr:isochorismatase family cysteine hydrolase [Phycisphaerales bacterium]